MRNKWKLAFFVLLLCLLLIPVVLYTVLFTYPDGERLDRQHFESKIPSNQKLLSVLTEREQVEDIINKELKKKAPNMNIYANLNNYAVLNGSFEAFHQELPYEITFEPEVMKNGDLVLKEKDIKVGKLPLPGEEVFKLLGNTIDFPNWVEIYPKDESVLLRITEIKTKPGYSIKTEEFDLKKNKIQFGVYKK